MRAAGVPAISLAALLSCGGPTPIPETSSRAAAWKIQLARMEALREDVTTELASAVVDRPIAPLSVIFVALDGVRWQDVFRGPDRAMLAREGTQRFVHLTAEELTPNMHAMLARGVGLGDREQFSLFEATGPHFVSLPGYTEMLTGRASVCKNNDCTKRPGETIADVMRALPDVARDEDVAIITSWERIAQVAAHHQMRVVESCGRTHGDTRFAINVDLFTEALAGLGPQLSPRPGWGDYRTDALTGPIAVHYVEEIKPRFLFLSLGDTDEWGHMNNYTEYLASLVRADRIIGELRRATERYADPSRILWLITADHGRAANFRDHGDFAPESGASWIIAEGPGLPARGSLWFTGRRVLRDIAPTIRAWIGAPQEDDETAGVPIPELLPAPRDEDAGGG